MSKIKTAREAILTTESWDKFKKETKVFLKEIGEMILFFMVMIYMFKLFGLLV
jgi:hypothetical protein